MRTALLALAISIAPFPALAICNCVCAGGTAVARCERPTDVEPICQVLCAPKVDAPSIALPGAPRRPPDEVMIEERNEDLRSNGLLPPDPRLLQR